MAFNRREAENRLRNTLLRIRAIERGIDRDIINYRNQDTLVSEEDEEQTFKDIRFYLLRYYREIDEVLTELDRYK